MIYRIFMMLRLGIISFVGLCCITKGTCSKKKGVGMGPQDLLCGDFEALNNISWWYDWRMNFWYYHTHTNCTHIDSHKFNHIPMIWGLDPKHPVAVPSNTPAILGYNEPNFKSQANMTAQQAADHWTEIERHSHGRPLVSPAAAPCSTKSKCNGNSFEWFDEFFRLCKGCRVDYLATHAYYCNADTTMDYLLKLYRRYGKKIWLTEFSCPRTMDYGHQLNYMKAILTKLEAANFVDRYFWYKARKTTDGFTTHTTSLLHSHSSTLTTLGRYYNDFHWSDAGAQIIG